MRLTIPLLLVVAFAVGMAANADTVTIRDLTTQGDGANVRDSYLRTGAAYIDKNFGNGWGQTDEFRIQTAASGEFRTGLYWFDLSGIPSSATITLATFSLWMDANGVATGQTMYLSRISAGPWVEGNVWNAVEVGSPSGRCRIHDTAAWGEYAAVGDSDIDATNTYLVTADGYSEQQFDVTNFVQSWVDGSHANYGMVLHAKGQSWLGSYRPKSSENPTLGLRPMLVVVYGDTPPPPSNVTAVATSCTSVMVSWDAVPDATSYKVYRDAALIGSTSGTSYGDSGLAGYTTYTYTVSTVNEFGESPVSNQAVVKTPYCYTFAGTAMKFDFDDNGNAAFSYDQTFYTSPEETTDFWFGKKNVSNDGGFTYNLTGNGLCNYESAFSNSGGDGSLTIWTTVSDTPADPARPTGRYSFWTNDMSTWFKWVRDTSSAPTYYRGMKLIADVNIVGNKYGWCEDWDDINTPESPDFPWVTPCDGSRQDWMHQGSDWGSSNISGKSGIYITIGPNQDLDEPGHTGQGNTGNGQHAWFTLYPGNIRDSSDDLLGIRNSPDQNLATFQFADGLGFGLIPEDGTANGCKAPGGSPYPRNGTIEGDCNRVVVTIGLCNAGGDYEYVDIWLTRPNGQTIHVNPLTCQWHSGSQSAGFGADGHTLKYDNAGDTVAGLYRNSLRLGTGIYYGIYGVKYNHIILRNDWDGDVTTLVHNLSELRSLPLGTSVRFDSTGGEKICTTASQGAVPTDAPYFFYVEQEDRSSGIRVVHNSSDPSPEKGKLVSLTGYLAKDADGNLFVDITNGTVSFGDATKTIEPVGLNNLWVAGADATAGSGLRNVGILATTWGKVTDKGVDGNGNTWFLLDDGSGTPVKCWDYLMDGTSISPGLNETWSITGPIALELVGSDYRRIIVVTGSKKQT